MNKTKRCLQCSRCKRLEKLRKESGIPLDDSITGLVEPDTNRVIILECLKTGRTNKDIFLDVFDTDSEAETFEHYALKQENLPPCALDVLAGKEATDEYWEFLISELAKE